MANPQLFSHISLRVIAALDKDFPGWRDLIPEDQALQLNEESLIQLLKDRNRAEIYRIITNRRNAFLKEAYEGSDRSFADLTKEFADFSAEYAHQWLVMEEKLSAILLKFKAKPAPMDFEVVRTNLETSTNQFAEQLDHNAHLANEAVSDYVNVFVNRQIEGAPRPVSDDVRSLINDKVNRLKDQNLKAIQQQKDLVRNVIQNAIQSKVDQIKAGRLDEDALDRSDLFTVEEVDAMKTAQERLLSGVIRDYKQLGVDSLNEASTKFLGVSGKDAVLKKLDEFSSDIVTPEIKAIVGEAFDRGGIFPDSSGGRDRNKRAIILQSLASSLLDYAAQKLWQAADKSQEELEQDRSYRNCKNNFVDWWSIIMPLFCSIHLAVVQSGSSAAIFRALSSCFTFMSFVIDAYGQSLKAIAKFVFKKVILPTSCDLTSHHLDNPHLSTACSAAILMHDLFELSTSGVPGAMKAAAGIVIFKAATDDDFTLPSVTIGYRPGQFH